MSERAVNPDEAFVVYYNDGNRRTLTDVAKELDVAYITVRRMSDEFDWEGQADAIDDEARRTAQKRLANTIAKHRVREVEAIATLQTKFFRRLMPSTAERPNPAELLPEDIDPRMFIELGKFFELLTGGATERAGVEGGSTALEEMERAIAEMDAQETRALPAPDGR